MNNPHIWLAFVAYPVTTAAYIERALRNKFRTTTIGPPLPNDLIEKWQLQNMRLPLKEQDISTGFTPDMREIVSGVTDANAPDLYLWVESVGGHHPINLDALDCPKVCYLIDSHLQLAKHLEWAKQFDFVFIAQREYLQNFRQLGMKVYWLPLGCDPEIHCQPTMQREHLVSFVGSVIPGSRREVLLTELNRKIPVHYERCFWEDMARLFSNSKIVFNESVKNDLNMRFFEALSSGALLLTDLAKKSGQEEMFREGEDYALYRDNNIVDVARFYLDNEQLREQIAARGQRLAHNAHTYSHRVDDLLAVVLGGKEDTFSADELRRRSLVGEADVDSDVETGSYISSSGRSFIIPVLDMSPASEFNILTLLDDLEGIDGDVIVIFNGQDIAENLRNHPRITRYAIMKHNIGVARAWNLGLEVAATPVVFILNADLHLEKQSVEALENALITLPDAACVGPQGSFVEYSLTRDYKYFDKGTFNKPIEVDAVSGFFFAIKLKHFNEKIIRFENGFTPCYFEEWDLGLQIKKAGLKNYIVPTSAYDHHWSGSIRALRYIGFYEKSETAGEIVLRNRRLFLNKWRAIAARENRPDLLESGFVLYVIAHCQELIAEDRLAEADQWLVNVTLRHPPSSELSSLRRFIDMILSKAVNTKEVLYD